MKFVMPVVMLLLLLVALHGVVAAALPASERGRIVFKNSPWGQYWQYAPHGEIRDVLVIAHGTVGDTPENSALALANRFILRWVSFAAVERLLVVSLAFDSENYQAAGGYRGLFGRHVGADEFAINVVEQYKDDIADYDGRFIVYGHSAGGQFVGRFVVRHPERVRAAILSAPGRYAFPDPNAAWPYGMGRYSRAIRWDPNEPPQLNDIIPDPDGWLKAAQLPLSILVGTLDTDPQEAPHPHKGMTRIELATHWVADMQELARSHGVDSTIRLLIVDGAGHSSEQLTWTAQQELEMYLKRTGDK